MARTLVGILQILLKQDVTQKAPAINSAIKSIEQQAERLGKSAWGAGFQRQLDRLKVTPAEAAAIRNSYDRLARDINGRINKADLANWRHGTLSHLTAVRAGLKETAEQAKAMNAAISKGKGVVGNMLKPALVALGAYTVWYAAGVAMREGFSASGERQREYFRQDMAGIPELEKTRIAAEAQRMTIAYPSVGMTETMEMARTARNTMGSTADGLAILEDMVRGLVTLQSAQGVETGSSSMMKLIRGLDNLGLNSGGEVGLKSMRDVMAGAIRASQIEGGELDVGQYFDFARRAKVAGPALSDEFLATTSGALMQDMTASGAGNAIAMFFKAMVLGDKSVAGKGYLAEQRKLGLRKGEGGPQGFGELVDKDMAGENPYQWVKKNLIPALQAQGIDLENDTAVASAVGKLSGNSNATGLMTRMVTQSGQIERLIGMYAQAAGPEAADQAKNKDPFVSLKGLTTSLGNLAAATGEHVMPTIIPALNSLTNTINGIAEAVQGGDSWQVGLGGLAALVAGIGAIKVGSAAFGGIIALTTAGPSLQTAAVMLQGAATSLGGGAAAGAAGTAVGGAAAAGGGALAWALKAAGIAGATYAVYEVMKPVPVGAGEDAAINANPAQQSFVDEHRIYPDVWAKGPSRRYSRGGSASSGDIMPGSAGWNPLAPIDTSAATAAGNEIETALSPTGKPTIDTSDIQNAIALVQQLRGLIEGVGVVAGQARGRIKSQIESSYSDYGIAP